MMNLSCLIFGIFFIAIGIAFAMGKLLMRMHLWKDMPEEDKAEIRVGPLCLNIGLMIALCGLIFLAGGLFEAFKDHAFVLCMVAWMALCIADVIYIDKSKRFLVKP